MSLAAGGERAIATATYFHVRIVENVDEKVGRLVERRLEALAVLLDEEKVHSRPLRARGLCARGHRVSEAREDEIGNMRERE